MQVQYYVFEGTIVSILVFLFRNVIQQLTYMSHRIGFYCETRWFERSLTGNTYTSICILCDSLFLARFRSQLIREYFYNKSKLCLLSGEQEKMFLYQKFSIYSVSNNTNEWEHLSIDANTSI